MKPDAYTKIKMHWQAKQESHNISYELSHYINQAHERVLHKSEGHIQHRDTGVWLGTTINYYTASNRHDMKVVASSLTPYIFVSKRKQNQCEHRLFFCFVFIQANIYIQQATQTKFDPSSFSPHPLNAWSCSQSNISLCKWERKKGEQTWEWEERQGWKGTVMRQICLWVKKWGQGIPESASLSFSPSSSSSSSTFSSLSGKGRQQQAHATTQNHDHNNSKCRGGATVLRDIVLMLLCTRNQVARSQSQQSSWGLRRFQKVFVPVEKNIAISFQTFPHLYI